MYWFILFVLLFLPLGAQETLPSWCPLNQTTPTIEEAEARSQVEVEGDRLIYRDSTGQEATVLKSRDLAQAQLSDNGQWIAFTRWENYRPASLWVLNLSNSETQLLISAEQLAAMRNDQGDIMNVGLGKWRWLPKSRRIVFNTALYFPSDMVPDFIPDDLWQVNIATGSVERLLEIGQGGIFYISPDGVYIAVMSADSFSLIKVVDWKIQPDTLPGFRINAFGEFNFYPETQWLSEEEVLLTAVNTGPDIILQHEGRMTIWRVSLSSGTGIKVNVFDAAAYTLRFSPDGRFVVYWRTHEPFTNFRSIMIGEVESGETYVYTSGESLQLYGWEADSQHFRYGYSQESPLIGDICGS